MAVGVVGTSGGTTNFDTVYANQLFVGGTITGSVSNTGTENSASEVLTSIACPGTITGSVLNATTVGVKGTHTGSRIDVTTLNVKGTHTGSLARLTNVECKGTIIGSKMSVGTLSYDVTGDLGVTGTVTGTYVVGSYVHAASITGSVANVKGTVTGSKIVGSEGRFADLVGSNISSPGTVTGTYLVGSYAHAASLVGSIADVKGTVTGSFLKGTLAPTDVVGSSLKAIHMLASKGTISHSATPGTYLHGLGAAPSFISVVPIAALQGATGTEGMAPFMPAAADATAVYVQSGTTGSSWVFALA